MSISTKEEVLKAIRKAASMAPDKRLTRNAFVAQSNMKVSDIFRYFRSWSEALSAAGLDIEPYNQKISLEDLLKDWGEIVRKHHQTPTRNTYKLQGKHSPRVFEEKFGSWSAVPSRFREFAQNKLEWSDVLSILPDDWSVKTSRSPIPREVPSHIAQDYREAVLVLPISPKASAALSRRCLQSVLREVGQTRAKDLADQIKEVLPHLPSRIADNLDVVRVIGNFAAHPLKSQATGIILDVEVGEADWNLDVLDTLFDYYYLRPELERKKREALNQKLKEAGKPPLK